MDQRDEMHDLVMKEANKLPPDKLALLLDFLKRIKSCA